MEKNSITNKIKVVSYVLILLVVSSGFTQNANSTEVTVPPTPAYSGIIADSGSANAQNYNSKLTVNGAGGISTTISNGKLIINGSGSGSGFTNSTLPSPPMSQYTVSRNETIYTNFQKGHGWVNQSTKGCLSSDDTSNFVLGNQSMKMVTWGNGTACIVRKTTVSPALDLTNKLITMWVKFNDTVDPTDVRLTVTNNAFTDFLNYNMWGGSISSANYFKADSWYRITFSLTQTTQTGSPNLASINEMQLRLVDSANGKAITMWINTIGIINKYDYPIISFTFDDGYQDQFTTAKPILDKYHYPATAYIITSDIGTSSTFLNLAQLHQMQDVSRWDISAHTVTHPDLTKLSSSQLMTEIHDPKIYLINNGFSKGADQLAYPFGAWNKTVIDLESKYYKTARTIAEVPLTNGHGVRETLPPGDYYRLRVVDWLNSTAVSTIENSIDQGIANNDWLIFELHHVVNSSATANTQILASNFQTVVDYINTKQVRVMTISQVLNDFSTKPGLKINTQDCGTQFVNSINNKTGIVGCATASGSSSATYDTLQNVGSGGVSVYAGNSTLTNFQIKKFSYGTGINATNGTNTVTVQPDIRYLQPQQLFFRTGTWTGDGSTVSDGILNGLWVVVMANETTARQIDTNGLYFKRTTAAGTSNEAGISASTFTERALNPDVFIKFRLNSLTDSRLFMGLEGSAALTGDDPCITRNCFLFGIKVNQTTFQIIKNDGVGSSVFVSTGVTVDTNIHTIELKADNTNSRFCWSLDSSAFSCETTDIPAAGTALGLLNEIQTAKAATKNMDTWFIQVNQDK